MIFLEPVIQNWKKLNSKARSLWGLSFFVTFFIFFYFFMAWKIWMGMDLFLSIFKLRLDSALFFYWFKLLLLGAYYFLFWAFLNYLIFLILLPLFPISLLLKGRTESSFVDRLKRSFYFGSFAFLSVMFSFTPFLLPLSFVLLACFTSFLTSPQLLILNGFVSFIRRGSLKGLKELFEMSVPILNLLFLPRYLLSSEDL